MDHQPSIVGELELQQIACAVRPDGEDLRWIRLGVKIEPTECGVEWVGQVDFRDAVSGG